MLFILHIHNFALILHVFEGFLSQLLCIHNVGMGIVYLHGLIVCVKAEGSTRAREWRL